ncbi:MAG: bifunctional phosphoglucose/phosphomannose isomerase [Bacteroidota bacterium]
MRANIEQFTLHLEDSLKITDTVAFKNTNATHITNVIISGLGGSGIGGTIVNEILSSQLKIPVFINKDYVLPDYVNQNTLVIACSYSGNTEETLNVFNLAMEKNAQIICISSGGKLSAMAVEKGKDLVTIPGGLPPRASFGYPFVQLLNVFSVLGFTSDEFKKQISEAIDLMRREVEEIKSKASELANNLFGKIPVIYSLAGSEGIALRFRQQLNENSKMLAWHNVFPEMNHNELVGWAQKNDVLAVVALRTSNDHPKNIKRLEICKPIISKCTASWTDINAKGNSRIAQTLYLIHLTDWASLFLANLKNIDPVEVNVIDYLKGELSKP